MTTHFETYSDIAAIPRDAWESLAHPSFYLSYDWLLARSATIRGKPRFFVGYGDGDQVVAAAPSYLTDQSSHPGYDPARMLAMDDLDDRAVEKHATPEQAAALGRLRRQLAETPGLARPALVLASPGLMGGVSYARGLPVQARREATAALIAATEAQAAGDGAATVAWFYLLEGADEIVDGMLGDRGYTRAVMGADCYLPIAWHSIEEYFASFRDNRRRTFRQEMAAFARSGASVDVHGPEVLGPELAELELQWRHKYGRQATLEGTLANYRSLQEHIGQKLLVFVARIAGRAIGFTIFLDDGPVWWARFGGFDYTSGVKFSYFNLVFYHPIRAAIARQVSCIAYSRTAYETKRSRGCSLRNFLAYVRLPPDSVLLSDLAQVGELQRRRFAHIGATTGVGPTS